MFNLILATVDGEILGVYPADRASEAHEDATEICSITRESLALHITREEECVLMVGDVVTGSPYSRIYPSTILNKKVDSRRTLV